MYSHVTLTHAPSHSDTKTSIMADDNKTPAQALWDHHAAAFSSRNLDELASEYDDNSVFIAQTDGGDVVRLQVPHLPSTARAFSPSVTRDTCRTTFLPTFFFFQSQLFQLFQLFSACRHSPSPPTPTQGWDEIKKAFAGLFTNEYSPDATLGVRALAHDRDTVFLHWSSEGGPAPVSSGVDTFVLNKETGNTWQTQTVVIQHASS